jgi:signal transduction histidine kinase
LLTPVLVSACFAAASGYDTSAREPSREALELGELRGLATLAIAQALVISLLVAERLRLRRDAAVTQRLSAELGRVTRSVAVAEITTAVSNRIAQPLTATLINAETAATLVCSPDPSIDTLRELLADLRADGERAATALDRFRDGPTEQPIEFRPVEIDVVIGKALATIRAAAQCHGIEVLTELAPRLPPIMGNLLHVQAIVLSLSLNAIEAMKDAVDGPRALTIVAGLADHGVRVQVRYGIARTPTGRVLPRLLQRLHSMTGRAGAWGNPMARAATAAFGGTLWMECTLTSTAVGFDVPTADTPPG